MLLFLIDMGACIIQTDEEMREEFGGKGRVGKRVLVLVVRVVVAF